MDVNQIVVHINLAFRQTKGGKCLAFHVLPHTRFPFVQAVARRRVHRVGKALMEGRDLIRLVGHVVHFVRPGRQGMIAPPFEATLDNDFYERNLSIRIRIIDYRALEFIAR